MSASVHRRLPFLGLRGKLLIAFVGLALIPVGVLATYTLHMAGEALKEANADHHRMELLSNAAHVENYIGRVESDVTLCAHWAQQLGVGSGAAGPGRWAKLERMFADLAEQRPDYYQLRLLSEAGRELVRVNRSQDAPDVVADDALQDKSQRYYVREAMALSPGETWFSPIDVNVERGAAETPERLVFRVARRVVDGAGQPAGLVIVNVFARQLLDRVSVLRPGPEGRALLIDDGTPHSELAAVTPGLAASLDSGEARFMVEEPHHFVSHVPVHGLSGAERWTLAVVYPRDQVLGPVNRLWRLTYGFAAGVGVVALLLAFAATRTLTKPIDSILAYLRRVARGEPLGALHVETRDEIEELASCVVQTSRALREAQETLMGWNATLQDEVSRQVTEIEELLDGKHTMELQVRRADRLASIGLVSASLAHEVGNPLAGMKTLIQVQLREPSMDAATRETLDVLLAEIDRLAAILERITGFVRPERTEPVTTTLDRVFGRVAFLVEREAGRRGVRLTLTGEDVARSIVIEEQRLEQVLLNLVMNALQAMTEPGVIALTGRLEPGMLEVVVSDTGPGIPVELRERVFEPFFTTKSAGTGLGLPIVRKIAREMGGGVSLSSPPSGGTTVTLHLAVGDPEVAETAPAGVIG